MASNTLSYKGFTGTAEIDIDDGICVGKLLFIDDLVMYESGDPTSLKTAFREAVDDYLATCAELGKEPQRPCSGTFNVRIAPKLHRQAVVHALNAGVTLNEVVVRAMDNYLDACTNVHHDVRVTFVADGTAQVITTGTPSWTTMESHRAH